MNLWTLFVYLALFYGDQTEYFVFFLSLPILWVIPKRETTDGLPITRYKVNKPVLKRVNNLNPTKAKVKPVKCIRNCFESNNIVIQIHEQLILFAIQTSLAAIKLKGKNLTFFTWATRLCHYQQRVFSAEILSPKEFLERTNSTKRRHIGRVETWVECVTLSVINQSIDRSIDQSINQSINQLSNQSVSQSVSQSDRRVSQTKQSINQSVSQAIEQSSNLSQNNFIIPEHHAKWLFFTNKSRLLFLPSFLPSFLAATWKRRDCESWSFSESFHLSLSKQFAFSILFVLRY